MLDLLGRAYDRSGKRSGAFDVLAWEGGSVLFAEAKHGGKNALRPSQKAWIEAALDEGVALSSLLVAEWGFGGGAEGAAEGQTAVGIARGGTELGILSPGGGIQETSAAARTWLETQPPEGRMTINGGDANTSTIRVKLSLRAGGSPPGPGVVEMRIRNGGGPWTKWRQYTSRADWELSEEEGGKVVYVQFGDRAGNTYDSRLLRTSRPIRPLRPSVRSGPAWPARPQ